MSWIFGITGKISEKNKKQLYSICKDPIGEISKHNTIILFGGIAENIYQKKTNNTHILLSGIPAISKNGEPTKFYQEDLSDHFFEDNRENIDGHYFAIQLSNNNITITNDLLGLREGYIYEKDNITVFSTRLDYISQFSNSTKIDLEQFSTSWLFQNQISTKSLVKGITRIGSGGKVEINNGTINYSRKNWLPNFDCNRNEDEIYNNLKSVSTFLGSQKISLGLSGGLDSRLLLSILMESDCNWQIHTFGSKAHPDCFVASEIATNYNLSHQIIIENFCEPNKIIETIKKYIGLAGVIAPATEFLQHNFYKELFDNNYKIIDGGFGEIFRRQFLNRAAIKGKNDILNKNIANLIPHFIYYKADIFSEEINNIFKMGITNQLEELFCLLPDPNKIGVENWLDLVAIKTRLPNIYGAGQNSLDSVSQAFMPFAQISTLNSAFSLSLNKRKDGIFFKSKINNQLKKYPLVKSGTTYPFGMPTLASWLYTKIKNKLGGQYHDNSSSIILDILKIYIFDLVESERVKKNKLYDYEKVYNLVSCYFKGNKSLGNQLDWWLSFELWSQSLDEK